MLSEVISLRVEVAKELGYYNGSFGIYSFYPLSNHKEVKLNSYGNFIVTGNTFQLSEGIEYDIEIEPTSSEKYGKGYGFISVKQDKPETLQSQQVYMKTLLNEKNYKAIIQKYPNEKVLDMMRDGTFDYSDIKGIGRVTYEKIKETLIDNLDIQEAIVELKDLNISFPMMKRLVDYFGNPQLVIQTVRENIYDLTYIRGIGFKTVDKFAMNRGDDKEDIKRIFAGMSYLLSQEENNGHCWISKFSLIEKSRELLGISRTVIETAIDNLPDEIFYVEGDTVARRVAYETERKIRNKLFQLIESDSKLKVKYDEDKIKKIEEEQGYEFTDEQKQAIKLAIENNLLVINGKGGVGKTTVLKGIVRVMDQYNHSACALSGKASKILSANGLNGSTIHRLLKITPQGFYHNEKTPLPTHILIIDESSMIDIYLFNSLLKAVENGYKVIIVGDSAQLAAISSGAVFRDLLSSNKIPQIELTKVQRQAAKSGILSTANEIREGNQIIKSNDFGKKVFGELKDLLVLPMESKDQIKDLTLDIAERKFKGMDLHQFQFITGRKSGGDISVFELNNSLQELFNPMKGLHIAKNKYKFYTGDKVIQCGNNYNAGEDGQYSIFNGTIGIIKKIEDVEDDVSNDKKRYAHIDFEGLDETIIYSSDQMEQVELAYAISCHRSQGSSIPYTLFVFDYSSFMLLSKNFVYTGLTRASKGCVMICELSALRHAIKTDVSNLRNTFLKDLLEEEISDGDYDDEKDNE